MRRLLTYMLCVMAALAVSSCKKNELKLTGTLADGKGQTLRIIYRAADKEKSFLVDNPMPLDASGSFSLKVATRYPTVMWIHALHEGKLLMPVYAERGDELTVSGKYGEPWAWTVKGNKVMEQYCDWARANAKALQSGDESLTNAAVAAYVNKEPDSRTAAFLLFTRFAVSGHESEYKSLLAKLELDEDDLEEMVQACMAPGHVTAPGNPELGNLRLATPSDSLTGIDLSKAKTTLLYFWRESPDKETRALIDDVNSDTVRQGVSVYMDTDTVRWHQVLRSDSVMGTTLALWSLGGETNPAVRHLAIPSTPYLIVAGANGKVTYRGSDTQKARNAVFGK